MLVSNKKAIEKQYKQPSLYEDIVDRLIDKGIQLKNVTRSHLSGVDEFHIRGLEVSRELADQASLKNKRILDIGCGLGGPCRMLGDDYNCETYGVDLSTDYIDAAKKLSNLVSAKIPSKFFVGDALDLPFEDGYFDVVWTQHVQMNIEDKKRFYSEINRVLAKNGTFVYYDIFKQYPIEINFPVPWADTNSLSYLQTVENMDSILRELHFVKEHTADQTDEALEFLETVMESKKLNNTSAIGLNLLLGAESEEKFGNVLNALQCGKIELQSGVYKKIL